MEQQHPTPVSTAIDECKQTIIDHIDRLITHLTEVDSPKKQLLYSIIQVKAKDAISDIYDLINTLHSMSDEELLKEF